MLEENTVCFKVHIKSFEEAVLYSKKYVDDLNLKYFFEDENSLTEEYIEKLHKMILEEAYEIAANLVEEAWDNMEE